MSHKSYSLTAYQIYSMEKIQEGNKLKISYGEKAKMIADQWKSLSKEEKNKYKAIVKNS